MKKSIVLLALILIIISIDVNAQNGNDITNRQRDKHKNFIGKGDLSLGALYFTNPVSAVRNMKYETRGPEVNLLFYPINKVGFEVNFNSFKYHNKTGENINSPNPDQSLMMLDNKKVLMTGSSIRYNFLEKYHCGTLYLQSGYSFGRFKDSSQRNIHRWEIASIGFTSSALRNFIPNLDMDFRVGIAKDNLNSNLPRLYKAGLSYQFGNIREAR